MSQCAIYVAGVQNGEVLHKTLAEFTCIRCANLAEIVGLRGFYVPTTQGWEFVSVAEALETSAQYAMGNKRV